MLHDFTFVVSVLRTECDPFWYPTRCLCMHIELERSVCAFQPYAVIQFKIENARHWCDTIQVYLANDILQNSRKKGPEFVNEFHRVLPRALKHILKHGDEKVDRNCTVLISIMLGYTSFCSEHVSRPKHHHAVLWYWRQGFTLLSSWI